MNIQIILMQKEQKIVSMIKICIIFITLLSTNIYAQSEKEDYILLNKVINYNHKNFNSIKKLRNSSNFSIENMNKYYKHKYLNEKNLMWIIGGKKDENGKNIPDYYTQEIQDDFQKKWLAKYDTLSKIFIEKDFELFLVQKNKKWEKDKLQNKNIKLIKHNKDSYFKYFISRPYYSLDKKYALIQFEFSRRLNKFYTIVYKKEKGNWVFNNIF